MNLVPTVLYMLGVHKRHMTSNPAAYERGSKATIYSAVLLNEGLSVPELVADAVMDPKDFVENPESLCHEGIVKISNPQSLGDLISFVAAEEIFSSKVRPLADKWSALFDYVLEAGEPMHSTTVRSSLNIKISAKYERPAQ
jgi:hypothetical protein